jgi:hypothetical protein
MSLKSQHTVSTCNKSLGSGGWRGTHATSLCVDMWCWDHIHIAVHTPPVECGTGEIQCHDESHSEVFVALEDLFTESIPFRKTMAFLGRSGTSRHSIRYLQQR